MFNLLTIKVQRVVISIFSLIVLFIGIKTYIYTKGLKAQNIDLKQKVENYKTKYKNIQIQKTIAEANSKACNEQLLQMEQYQNKATTVIKAYQTKRKVHVKNTKFNSINDVINYAHQLQ